MVCLWLLHTDTNNVKLVVKRVCGSFANLQRLPTFTLIMCWWCTQPKLPRRSHWPSCPALCKIKLAANYFRLSVCWTTMSTLGVGPRGCYHCFLPGNLHPSETPLLVCTSALISCSSNRFGFWFESVSDEVIAFELVYVPKLKAATVCVILFKAFKKLD